MLTIAIFNLKGGTLKSATALNLGACLAKKFSVGLIDLDGQRTLSFGLGMDGTMPTSLDWLAGKTSDLPLATGIKNLSLIPGDIGLFRLSTDKNLMDKALKGIKPLDVYLLDCPPSLSVASVQAILNSDLVLMPTLCEPASLKGLSDAIGLIRDEVPDKPISVLRGRYRPRLVLTRETDDLLIEAAEDMNFRLLHTTIPENIAVAESIAQQMPVGEYAPKSPGAIAYRSLAKEVTKVWGLQ